MRLSLLPNQGDRFVSDGLIFEAQESGCNCSDCFFMNEEEGVCNLCVHYNGLPICHDPYNDKDIIYKFVREATDDEIRKGVADV